MARQRKDSEGHGAEDDKGRIQDGQSARQRAEAYRLATAKIPLSGLTCEWKRGRNRPLRPQQVARLREDFKVVGIEREAEEHFLSVQCSAAAVEDMLRHMGMSGEQDDARDGVLCFRDWGLVHPELRAEVMAGQHRIEALRQYGTERGCGASELWWTCHIYDKGMENGQGTRWGREQDIHH